VILDSSYLFDLMAGDEAALRTGNEIAETDEVQWLPTPVVAEVYYGVEYTKSEAERRMVQNALMGYPKVAIDEEIARVASGLLAEADREAGGNSGVETNDAYIGAVADVLGDPVLTANVGDFRRLGVETKSY